MAKARTEVGSLVRQEFIRRRIAIVDDAWSALVNATDQAKAVVAEAHKWVQWRKGATRNEDELSSALPELDDWIATYERARHTAGDPDGAPAAETLLAKVEQIKEPSLADEAASAATSAVKTIVVISLAVSLPIGLLLLLSRRP